MSGFRNSLSFRCLVGSVLLCINPMHGFSAAFWSKAPRLLVQPSAIQLNAAGPEHGLLVTSIAGDGTVLDVTTRSRFTSGEPGIIAVSSNGVCRAIREGQAQIVIE